MSFPTPSEEGLKVQAISPCQHTFFSWSHAVGSTYYTTDRTLARGAQVCPTGALHTKPKALCIRVHTWTHRQKPLLPQDPLARPAASRPSKFRKNLLELFFSFLMSPPLLSASHFGLYTSCISSQHTTDTVIQRAFALGNCQEDVLGRSVCHLCKWYLNSQAASLSWW